MSCRRAREDARRPQTPGANGKHLLGLINDAVIALQLVLQLERVRREMGREEGLAVA